MLDEKLGHLLRNIRLEETLKSFGDAVLNFAASWDVSEEASKVVDVKCAERLYAIGYHDAMTEAIRLCKSQVEKHISAVEFQASARNYLVAGTHQIEANAAKRCEDVLCEALKRKGGA